ncbi:hypothetical protein [Anaerotignum sp.]|uniref:hypothetical protein n=1 Tax=Anaerotignum sp. TaxID=2039241 RepID=UPI00289DC407|nr:hypothetical protein [Anaerotignum sp.]
MYHNPNLPYPFSSRTCGRPMHQRPTPASNWVNIPTNCNEPPTCREQPVCEEKPVCKKQPVCEEKPICKENPQVKNCQPQPSQVCENPCCHNPVTEDNLTCPPPCNNSCCNGNQLIFILLILYLFGMN